MGIALIGTRFVEAAVPPGMPYWIEFRVDAIVAVLAALMAGLVSV